MCTMFIDFYDVCLSLSSFCSNLCGLFWWWPHSKVFHTEEILVRKSTSFKVLLLLFFEIYVIQVFNEPKSHQNLFSLNFYNGNFDRKRFFWKFNSPDKILAMTAECWLLEESWNEAMVFDVVDVLFLQRSFAPAILQRKLTIGIGFLAMIVVSQLHSACLHKIFELYPQTFKFD